MDFNFKNVVKGFLSNFSSYTEVTNSSGIDVNPISTNLETMNAKPKYKVVDGLEYLKFGNSDDVDVMFDKLMYKSATHSGIVTKKAKMITGSGLMVNHEMRGTKNAKIGALIKHAGGANVSLYEIMTKASFEYTRTGAFGIIVDFGTAKDGKTIPDGIVKMQVVPARNMRFQKPTDGTSNYTHMVYKKSFKSGGAELEPAESIPLFDPFGNEPRQLLYVKNPYSLLDSYGTPNWIGAFNFIEADYEFGKAIENAAKNGFAPKTHITMIGRNMSKEERRKSAENIATKLSGSEGEQVVVSFVGKQDDAPRIENLEISNLDKTIDVMSNLNDAKILTAHNITSPALFGVMTAGKLGGTGTEMLSAYKLFKATETVPDRKIILSAFESLFSVTELADVIFEIIEEDIEVDFKTKPVEGGNTKDNPNIKSNEKKGGKIDER